MAIFHVRVGKVLVGQRELDRQAGVSRRDIPQLPDGLARWEGVGEHEAAAAVNAFTFLRWMMRQYPDQEVTLSGSNGGDARLLGRAHAIEDEAAAAGRAAELAARGEALHDAAMVSQDEARRRPTRELVRQLDQRSAKGRGPA